MQKILWQFPFERTRASADLQSHKSDEKMTPRQRRHPLEARHDDPLVGPHDPDGTNKIKHERANNGQSFGAFSFGVLLLRELLLEEEFLLFKIQNFFPASRVSGIFRVSSTP